MLTYAMTLEEMEKELTTDMFHLMRYLDHQENQYRRMVLKATRFPFRMKPVFYTSPRKNQWMVLTEVPSRKAVHSDDSKTTFVCMLNHSNGIFCFMPLFLDNKMWIMAYLPHFFSRYASRTGLTIHGKPLIQHYFTYNASYVYKVNEGTEDGKYAIRFAASSLHGVGLGLAFNQILLFKTFLTYDMLRGEQAEIYLKNEKIRQEIHEKGTAPIGINTDKLETLSISNL